MRLTAPGLGVDAAIDAVGVRPDGQMILPADVDRVGWYRFGPAPGCRRSAVIAGHVDDREQGLGALAPLREAEVGAGGRRSPTPPGRRPAGGWSPGSSSRSRSCRWTGSSPATGPPRLTLITCGGPFLPEFGSYRDNVVVVAEPLP